MAARDPGRERRRPRGGRRPPRHGAVRGDGYRATLRYVGEQLDCAYSMRRRHVFVGEDARRRRAVARASEVVLMPVRRFRDHLCSGQLTDVAADEGAQDDLGLLGSS